MNATTRPNARVVDMFVETYGEQVLGTVEWADLPDMLEANGAGEDVWSLAEDLGLRAQYKVIDVMLWLGF